MKETTSGVKESSATSQAKNSLTNQALHPERFLLERRKVGASEVLTDEKLKAKILENYRKQGALESALHSSLSKGLL